MNEKKKKKIKKDRGPQGPKSLAEVRLHTGNSRLTGAQDDLKISV